MSVDYINEAFKRLSLLNETMFDTSLNGINELSDFLDAEDDTVRVIDSEATDVEELQDSYIGKVIINCNVCHSHIFKDKEDIVIDEDNNVNAEDNCPYCNECEGFKIVGEITPYSSQETQSDTDNSTEDTSETTENSTEPLDEGVLGNFVNNLGLGQVKSLFDSYEDNDAEDCKQSRATRRNMTEDFKEVSIKTEDQHLEMTSDENGKITVVSEPVADTNASETISPVSDETLDAIVSNNQPEEEILQDDPIEGAEQSDEDDQSDISIEEIDEQGFDELGEAFFHNVYNNVESFKTTSVGANDSSILIEGTIKFDSGVEKNTGFIFEANDVNARGKVRFKGLNKHLCESSDAFYLVGSVDNKKLFVESLKYNYVTNNIPVRGIVRRK